MIIDNNRIRIKKHREAHKNAGPKAKKSLPIKDKVDNNLIIK